MKQRTTIRTDNPVSDSPNSISEGNTEMKIMPGALLLACLCIAMPLANAAGQSDTPGGNRALMEVWNDRKTAVKEEIYDKLKREGKLPKDGRIEFEARIKADPNNKNKVDIQVDKLRIVHRSQNHSTKSKTTGGSSAEDGDFTASYQQPMFFPQVEMRSIEFTGSEVIQDFVELQEIVLPGSATPPGGDKQLRYVPSQPSPVLETPKEPGKTNWWKRLFGD